MAVKTFQSNFTNGEISPLMEGRIDFAKYFNSAHCMENFLVYPHGPATFRPGFRFIKGTKTNSTASRLIPFIFAEDDAFALEFGANYIRFYKSRAQIVKAYAAWATTTFYKVGSLVTNSGNYYRCLIAHKSGTFATDLSAGKWAATAGATDLAYEVYSPYAAADVGKIKFCQSCDILYLWHPDYAPRKLMRVADDDWTLQTINFRPPPLVAAVHKLSATLTPAATTGDDITFTAGSAVFLSGDAGRTITSGTGRAIISSVTSTTEVICDIIDDFASTEAIASGSWSLSGPAVACLKPSDSPTVGSRFTLTVTAETGEDNPWIHIDTTDAYTWQLSATGTDEYYLRYEERPSSKPSQVRVGSSTASTEGTKGSLTAGQWDWAQAQTTDNPPVNFNTLYVRLSTSQNPYSQQGIWRSTSTVLNDVFRSADVGKYISLFGGVVKIVTVTTAQQIIVEVMKEMDYDSVYVRLSTGVLEIQSTYDWTLYESMWSATNGYPSCGVFYEDRLNTAGVPAYPETICGTVSGDYENYALGTNDDDAYSFTLNGRTVSYVRWLDPREFLIAGAIGSEWRIGPEDTTKALTATNVTAKQQTNYGCADIDPLTIGHSTLFVQSALRKIREFTLDSTSINNDYVAPDLTMLAEHVTEGKIAGMCYQQEPLSIIWAWMKDGTLASMTYQRDEDVIGWARHPMDNGEIESMIALPGDQYDEVYAVIKRTINGSTVRYIEVLEKVFNDDNDTFQANYGENAFFFDSGITQSGWNETTSYYLKITGASYAAGATLTITATGHTPFSSGSVGKKYRIRIDEDVVDITITAYTSTSVVSGTCTSAIPTGLQNTNTYDWALLATAITGLSHLEGEEVAILADGTVRTSQTVSSGQVTISSAASIIHAGLAYTGKLTTVRPELSLRDGTSQGRTKRVVSLVIRINNSGTFKAGRDETNLDEYGFKIYDQELYQTIFANSDSPLGTPAALFTGDKPCPFDGEFNTDARLTIIQDKPLPLTVVAIMADVEVTG